MRLEILTTLILLPIVAHGQATTPAASKLIPTSAVVQAELTQPAGLAAALKASAAADASTAASSMNTVSRPAVREFIQTRVTEDFVQQALRTAGTLEYGFTGSELTEETAPKMIRSANMQLSGQELASVPDLTQVAVSGTVDEYGFLRNLTITKSAGKAIDEKALAEASEYRYKPATVNNEPVKASVTIAIKIEKQ